MSKNILHAQSLHEQIATILLREWDPIGIQDIPEAQDEYDAYVVSLYKMLISNASEQDIFKYLIWVETEHMGLSADKQQILNIAKKLTTLSK